MRKSLVPIGFGLVLLIVGIFVSNLIIDLISTNVQSLNGKFINLLGEEIPW